MYQANACKASVIICVPQYDLIHLGAKFSPCMRKDDNMEAALEYDRDKERETACCVRNDGSGCVQVAGDECSVGDAISIR